MEIIHFIAKIFLNIFIAGDMIWLTLFSVVFGFGLLVSALSAIKALALVIFKIVKEFLNK